MAISRMQQPQQMQAGLGSLQDPRQGYFLGKLVKKATRAVKKVAKSPLGKMALIGGGAYLLGGSSLLGGKGMFTGGQGLTRFGNIGRGLGSMFGKAKTGLQSKEGMMGKFGNMFRVDGDKDKDFSMGRMLAGGLGATALAMPFLGGKEEPEVEEEQMDPAYQTQRARNFYSGQGEGGVGLNFMPEKKIC